VVVVVDSAGVVVVDDVATGRVVVDTAAVVSGDSVVSEVVGAASPLHEANTTASPIIRSAGRPKVPLMVHLPEFATGTLVAGHREAG
jgi:hypothetical protein